jgi:hypothetical protein
VILALSLLAGSQARMVFCIQYRDGGGTWRAIRNTETVVNPVRFLDNVTGSTATVDIPFNTILRSTEIPVAFTGLRVAHATKTGAAQYNIGKASFTIIPLHCAVP